MSFRLVDVANREHVLEVNAWCWRPILRLLEAYKLLPSDCIEALQYNGTGAEVSQDEARRIAEHLRVEVLPSVGTGERMLWDGHVTATPDDRTLYRDDTRKNYSLTHEDFVEFLEFCESCGGFEVQ